jgi:hypothetical protein
MKKMHNDIAYHKAREPVAAGIHTVEIHKVTSDLKHADSAKTRADGTKYYVCAML